MTASASPASRRVRTALVVLVSMLIAVASSCALFVVVQPSSYRIERDTAVRAPPERVHALFADVRALAAWDPWRAHPGVSRTATFSPRTTGVGAWVQWSSREGTTRMTLISDTPESVEYRDDMNGRVDASRQRFAHGRRSRLTSIGWTFSGVNNLVRRVLWPFAHLEDRIGPDMEASLARLVAMLDGA